MPETWTPEKNERLLLVALEAGMIDCNKLAARWTLKYGTDVSQRAIYQHLKKLEKDHGTGTGSNKTASPRKPATPRKSSTAAGKSPKTPSSTNKRRKMTATSEEDDSEREKDVAGLPAREKSRRSKTPRSYVDHGSDDEDASARVKKEVGQGEADAMSEVSEFGASAVF